MKASIAAFSAAGRRLGHRVVDVLTARGWTADLAVPRRLVQRDEEPMPSASIWAAGRFDVSDALVVIGSCGLAVRLVAPLVASKATDPAVVVLDDGGRFAVSLLSGHLGGANRLAEALAADLGSTAVVTTATDGRGLTAIDTWAADQGLNIENLDAIAPISAALLDGMTPGWWTDESLPVPAGFETRSFGSVGAACTARRVTPPFDVTLWLRPPVLVLGVGCRRGVEASELCAELERFLAERCWALGAIGQVASIELKANEPGLLELIRQLGVNSVFFSAEALSVLPGTFSRSEWVLRRVGVDCVCERAACAAAGGPLVESKWKGRGVTFALARSREGEPW